MGPAMSNIFYVQSFKSVDETPMRYGILRSEPLQEVQAPVIFIPGLGGSVKNALSFLERFLPHHGAVYSMDARGFGLNEAQSPHPNPQDYLRDFHQFVLHLQEKALIQSQSTPILLGISLGGVFATLYTTNYTHPFKAEILVAPAFHPHPQLFSWRFKLQNYSMVLFKGSKALTTLPYGIHELTKNSDRHDDPWFQNPLTMPTLYLFFVDMLCKKAFKCSQQIQIPTAVVVPELDVICNPDSMKLAYQQISQDHKALFSYANLYHDVFMEPESDQEKVYQDLHQWLSKMKLTHSAPAMSSIFTG